MALNLNEPRTLIGLGAITALCGLLVAISLGRPQVVPDEPTTEEPKGDAETETGPTSEEPAA